MCTCINITIRIICRSSSRFLVTFMSRGHTFLRHRPHLQTKAQLWWRWNAVNPGKFDGITQTLAKCDPCKAKGLLFTDLSTPKMSPNLMCNRSSSFIHLSFVHIIHYDDVLANHKDHYSKCVEWVLAQIPHQPSASKHSLLTSPGSIVVSSLWMNHIRRWKVACVTWWNFSSK